MSDITKNDAVNDPTAVRDGSKEYNQCRPTSLRSSGTELDPCCEGGMNSNFSAGVGESFDAMVRKIDGRKK